MKIYVEPIFLPQFRIFGALIILFGIPGFYALQIPWALRIPLWAISIAVGMFLLFGSQRLEIDRERKRYRSLISVLNLFNSGTWRSYPQVENLFIKRSKESQTMALGPIQRSYSSMVYDVYLKITSDEKIFLGSGKSKQKLMQKIAPLKTYLDVELIDYSKDR